VVQYQEEDGYGTGGEGIDAQGEGRRTVALSAAAQLTRWWWLLQPEEDSDRGVGYNGLED
jgi:hypothetical protein